MIQINMHLYAEKTKKDKMTKEILALENNDFDLSERTVEIDLRTHNKEAREIISEIKKVMKEKNLVSLFAPAIGYNKRIFCFDFKDREIKTFINPIIASAKGLQLSRKKIYINSW